MTDESFDPDVLTGPALDEAFAERVLRVACAELASEGPAASLPVRARQALVPLLLLSAGGCRTALTVKEIPEAFAPPAREGP